MTEGIAATARALGIFASAQLVGTAWFLLQSGTPGSDGLNRWARCWIRVFPVAVLALLLALVTSLLAQAAIILDARALFSVFDPAILRDLILDTHFGRIWLFRAAVASLLLIVTAAVFVTPGLALRRAYLASVLALAAIGAAAAPLTGHATGSERAAWLVPAHMIHVLAICIWLGGLPAWIGLAHLATRRPSPAVVTYAARAMRRFSRLAMVSMACIVSSGSVIAWEFVDDQGDLLGTRYGLLLLGKLFLLTVVVIIANDVRRRFLPMLSRTASPGSFAHAGRVVGIEFTFALGILVFGGWLAQTTPAVHDQPAWWLPFRLSLDATWPVWPMPMIAAGGALIALAGLADAVIACRTLFSWRRIAAAGTLAAIGTSAAAWALAVPAFPDTYRRPDTPYLTVSIARGRQLFESHCVSCHGTGGHGDGRLAASLPVPPANLSEPHTALHTAGDMFWWFTHGIPQSGMPGFGDVLSAEERWDLVNFLRAFSQGFEARTLKPEILPLQPWLGAPVFYFDDASGDRADLKDSRRRHEILLVFFSVADAQSRERLALLSAAAQRLEAAGLRVIAISTDPAGDRPNVPGPGRVPVLHGAAAQHVWDAYQLLSRTLGDRGDADRIGMHWRHAEFLIDRFGYVRARWIPADLPQRPDEIDKLLQQVSQLRREPEIRPPPDLHIH